MIPTKLATLAFTKQPKSVVSTEGHDIYCFSVKESRNIDLKTVSSFGEEWKKFNSFSADDIEQIGRDYFDILPPEVCDGTRTALDLGCGSGRWASYISKRMGFVECVDPSEAVYSAAVLLKDSPNVRISQADVDTIPFEDGSFDLVYSLGVLHHIPDTAAAMANCVGKLRRGGYFLVYLYYSLDSRGVVYKSIFRLVNVFRAGICRMRPSQKKLVCDMIAATVYWPLSRFSGLMNRIGFRKLAKKLPLSYYSDKSYWIMKNDALDRFGTPLEQRFSKNEIRQMMESCGLQNISFSANEPYWHAIGQKL